MVRYWMSLWLGVVGAIPILGGFANGLPASGVLAQSVIVPDETLGVERSNVIPNFNGAPIEAINQGAQRGQNLFHSFSQFNVSEGRSAYFFVPDNTIRNVLTRVTGTNASEILGRLGTFQVVNNQFTPSNANFFLVNPNGVIFGPSSSLDIGGSVVVTTANALQFSNGELFSATVPTIPSSVLTVDPSALLYNAINAQNKGIVVRSALTDPNNLIGQTFGLQVPKGQNLLLVGGYVKLGGGILQARGGRVELGGLSEPGTVGLGRNSGEFKLQFGDGVARSDISLINSPLNLSGINVAADGSGSITIYARNLEILGSSVLQAGIEFGAGGSTSRAGNVNLDATGSIRMQENGAGIFNLVRRGGEGNAGDIIITADSLNVTRGAALSASTFGQGDAGNISITVRDVTLFDGVGSSGLPTFVGGQVISNSMGKGGNLTLTTDSLIVTNGAQLSASTFGQGDAGNISITVRNATVFDGVGDNGFPSFAGSEVGDNAMGKGGTLTLTTGSLAITNGASLSSSTSGNGDAGNILITVQETSTVDGSDYGRSSFVGSQVGPKARGKGGMLELTTGSLIVTNGAQLTSSTFGQGDAGNVSITARDAMTFDGIGNNGFSSAAGSQVSSSTAVGKGGILTLITGSLTVTNGAQLTSTTFGQGDAGNISITVRNATIFDGLSSSAGSQVESTAVGNGGKLTLKTGSLIITNGASLSSRTTGLGDAGDIILRVQDTMRMDNSRIVTGSLVTSGGKIDIEAKSIRLLGNSDIITSVFNGAGGGGDIKLSANSIIALNDSDILAFARDGKGGNVTLNTRAFFGQNYRPAPFGTDPATLDGNDRVDINASGTLSSGIIQTPDTSFIQNGLNQLSKDTIDTTKLLSNTCLVRQQKPEGTFYITGTGGLPQRPGDLSPSQYPTNTITPTQSAARPWQKGDPIVEPTGFYTLTNGRLVMSRECDRP